MRRSDHEYERWHRPRASECPRGSRRDVLVYLHLHADRLCMIIHFVVLVLQKNQLCRGLTKQLNCTGTMTMLVCSDLLSSGTMSSDGFLACVASKKSKVLEVKTSCIANNNMILRLRLRADIKSLRYVVKMSPNRNHTVSVRGQGIHCSTERTETSEPKENINYSTLSS